MKKNILPSVLILIAFSSCSKKQDYESYNSEPCDSFLAPYASNTGPVQAGQNVQLYANTNEINVTFKWTGPNNYTSTKQNPVINNITFSANGNYFVQMTGEQCISNQSGTNVIVTEPCTNNVNQGLFNSLPWDFSPVTCGPDANGLYKISGYSANGTLSIYFNKLSPPAEFVIYPIDGTTNPAFDSSMVQVRIVPAGGYEYVAQGGLVYIGDNGASLKASFCTVSFYSSVNGITITGKSRVVCN